MEYLPDRVWAELCVNTGEVVTALTVNGGHRGWNPTPGGSICVHFHVEEGATWNVATVEGYEHTAPQPVFSGEVNPWESVTRMVTYSPNP